MAVVRPFRGLRYVAAHAGDLGCLIAPPFDVISPAQQRALHEASPFNECSHAYLAATRDALFMRDIITGLVKSIVFGLVITGVGCQEGFSTGAGSEQVGRSTTSAVVTSIFLVVFADLLFTAVFYMTSGT